MQAFVLTLLFGGLAGAILQTGALFYIHRRRRPRQSTPASELPRLRAPDQKINSERIVKKYDGDRHDTLGDCEIVVSAPGTVFFAGEKVIIHGATATCLRVPRRVHVGLRLNQRSGVAPLTLDTSKLVHEGHSFPTPPRENDGSTDLLAEALGALTMAYEILYGEPPPAYDVKIWSEWRGETGLGWSGAFAASIACALLVAAGKLESPPDKWPSQDPKQLARHPDFLQVLKLAWVVEAVIHGGRASGSAVCGSMLATPLPYFYRAPSVPRLWKPPEDDQDKESPTREVFLKEHPEAIYKRLLDYANSGDWSFQYAGYEAGVADKGLIHQVWEQLLEGRHFLVINTNTVKSTAKTGDKEWSDDWKERLLPGYIALVVMCELISDAIENCVRSTAGLTTTKTIDNSWNEVLKGVHRAHGFLVGLGFSFGLGEEIIAICQNAYGKPLAAKTSGAGKGGNVIIAASGLEEDRDEIYRIVRQLSDRHMRTAESKEEPRVSVMYDAALDGPEPNGLQAVRH